jgi:hypothetical protein
LRKISFFSTKGGAAGVGAGVTAGVAAAASGSAAEAAGLAVDEDEEITGATGAGCVLT